MKKSVVSLIRVSTDQQAQDDKGGLDRQRRDIRITCQKFGLQDMKQFELEGITGTNVRNTKQFRELKAMVARKDIIGLVIPSIDRLSRSTEFATIAELFSPFEELLGGKSTKRLYTRTNELDVNKPSDRDIIWSQLRFAEEERLMILYRTSSGRDEKRLDADANVDRLPNGVIFTRTNPIKNIGVWSYDPIVKARMRSAYHRVLAGESLASLYKESGFNNASAFRSTLESPFWKGIKSKIHTHEHKVWNEDKGKFMPRGRKALPEEEQILVPLPALRNDPCVSDEIWDAVQDKLRQNTMEWTRKDSQANSFLGSGLYRCRCGRKLYLKMRGKYQYYYCAFQRLKTGEPCNETMIPAKLLDNKVIGDVTGLFTDEAFIMTRIKESLNTEKTDEKKLAVARHEKELESLEREKGRVAVAIRKAPNVDVIIAQLQAIEEDMSAVREKLRVAKSDLALVLSDGDVKKLAARMTKDFEGFPALDTAGQKDVLNKYVNAIHVTWNREPVKFAAPTKEQLETQSYMMFDVKTGAYDLSSTTKTQSGLSFSCGTRRIKAIAS